MWSRLRVEKDRKVSGEDGEGRYMRAISKEVEMKWELGLRGLWTPEKEEKKEKKNDHKKDKKKQYASVLNSLEISLS